MKIIDVKCHLLTCDLDKARQSITALRQPLRYWTTALAEVVTDDGASGIGECYAGLMAPLPVKAIVEQYRGLLLGEDPENISHLFDKMCSKSIFWGKAGLPLAVVGTIENALWDLKGKILKTPVWKLLGGGPAKAIKVYASGGLESDPKRHARELEDCLKQGFRAVKIRVWNSLEQDVAKMRLSREVVGNGVDLMVDAVMGHNPRPWSAKEALMRAKVMEDLNVRWFEDPVGNRDYRGCAEVRQGTSVPVAGGESATGVAEYLPFLEARALDIVQPDPSHSGGIIECQRIAALARAHGAEVVYHSWGAAPCLWANYHLAFSDPLVRYLEFPTHRLPLIDELSLVPFTLKDGCFLPPSEPGLGVHLPTGVLKDHPFQPGTEFWT